MPITHAVSEEFGCSFVSSYVDNIFQLQPNYNSMADSRRMRNGAFQAYPRGGSTVAPVPIVLALL